MKAASTPSKEPKMSEMKSPTKPPPDVKKEQTTPTNKNSGDTKPQSEERRSDSKHNDRSNQHGGDKGDRRGGFDRRGGHQGRYQHGQRGGSYSRGRDDRGHDHSDRGNQGQNYGGMAESSVPKEPKKFTGRCRLFVGNITPDTTEEQFKSMFTPFGEVSEIFVNAARGFGFIRLDYRINAEKAKAALDGEMRNNRVLRVRFATHGAALKVTNISPFVSNELLENAFSQFGEVERAVVIVDDRGRPTGEGLVEFARKPGATAALKRIQDGVFLLTSYPRPVHVELLEQKDEEDGLTEKFIQKTDAYRKDREKEPRFAAPGSFEFEFALKWRRIDEMEKERIERVKKEMDVERNSLEGEMETAMYDYQAEQIRQDLLRQQEELKRLEEMKNEQMRRRQEMDMRRQEDRLRMEGEERRRQEMMMRGGRPDMRGPDMQVMSQNREEMMRNPGGMRDSPSGRNRSSGPGTPPMLPPPIPPGMNLEQGGRGQGGGFGGPGGQNMGGGGGSGGNMGPGGSPNVQGNQNQGMGSGGQMQRQGQFEGGQGGFRGGPGGQGGNFNPGMGGMGGGPGQGNMYPGNMRNNQNMNEGDRRRERNAGNRDDYGDMKRMRRY